MSTKRAWVVLALSVGLVACGTGGAPSGGGSGEPITIMVTGQLQATSFQYPDMEVAARAAAKRINDTGGILGRQVVIESCNDGGDTNRAAQCARQAVEDQVVAVTGFGVNGASMMPVFERANVPYIVDPISPAEFTSRVAFAISTPSPVQYVGIGSRLVQDGCATVGTAYIDGYAASEVGANAGMYGAQQAGGVVVRTSVNQSAPDFSPAVQSLVSQGAQCALPVVLATNFPRYTNAVQNVAPGLRLAYNYDGLPQRVINEIGGARLDNMLIAGSIPPYESNPDSLMQMVADMRAIDPNVVPTSKSVTAYQAPFLVRQAAEKVGGDITNTTVLQALGTLDNADAGPALGILDFTRPGPITSMPRVFNTGVYFSVLRNGQYTDISERTVLGSEFGDVKTSL